MGSCHGAEQKSNGPGLSSSLEPSGPAIRSIASVTMVYTFIQQVQLLGCSQAAGRSDLTQIRSCLSE